MCYLCACSQGADLCGSLSEKGRACGKRTERMGILRAEPSRAGGDSAPAPHPPHPRPRGQCASGSAQPAAWTAAPAGPVARPGVRSLGKQKQRQHGKDKASWAQERVTIMWSSPGGRRGHRGGGGGAGSGGRGEGEGRPRASQPLPGGPGALNINSANTSGPPPPYIRPGCRGAAGASAPKTVSCFS